MQQISFCRKRVSLGDWFGSDQVIMSLMVRDKINQVLVVNGFLFVGEFREGAIRRVKIGSCKLIAKIG